MADKLLPCPFCGGEAEIREIFVTGFHNALFIAKCRNIGCGAIGSECVKKETAIEKWNNRHSPWHTGTLIEKGWYLLKYKYKGCSDYIYKAMYFEEFSELPAIVKWQKINEGGEE